MNGDMRFQLNSFDCQISEMKKKKTSTVAKVECARLRCIFAHFVLHTFKVGLLN